MLVGTPLPGLAQAIADVVAEAVAAATPSTSSALLPPAELTVAQLATRFARKPSCIRAWHEAGKFAGAYRLHGREWRVPLADVLAFEAAQRTQPAVPRKVASPAPLSAWRRTARSTPTRRRRKVAR